VLQARADEVIEETLLAAVHESVPGTMLPIRDDRNPVATGGEPDMARTAQFGRD
jgi:hypothetical protein